MDFLARMARSSRERADRLDSRWPAAALDKPVFPLRLTGFDLIAELKDASPAEGVLAADGAGRAARARAYVEGGAAAVSVLTEPDRFAGSMQHLEEVVAALAGSGIGVMRKDFLTATAQIYEARAGGASGVLLIAALLEARPLRAMLDCAFELGLFVLLESFDEEDLRRSAALLDEPRYAEQAEHGRLLVGINSRDLRSLEVDPERLERLAPLLPEGASAVAESGLAQPGDTARVAALGYALGLVGTALMKSNDPASLLRELLAAGRGARAA